MILTERRLRQAASEVRSEIEHSSITKRMFAYDSAIHYDLFFSHSFKDKDLVTGLYHLFYKANYKVYIDWIDDITLDRTNVTPNTASIIKSRIMNSNGISYIATSNSTSSKWCPWELGVADGAKGKVCILPVMDDSFKGQEYLGLYPYIEYARISGKPDYDFWIHDQKNTQKYIILKDWLAGKLPYLHT